MLINDSLVSLQNNVFNILIEVDKICKKNSISYWLDGGTLLGAVRHGGFIPWDDDIDIAMPLSDYNHFLKIAQTQLPSHLFLQTGCEDKKPKTFFAKIRDSRTFLLEINELPSKKYHQGSFIDIFPMIKYPKINKQITLALVKKVQKSYLNFFYSKYSRIQPSVGNGNRLFIKHIIYLVYKSIWNFSLFFLKKSEFISNLPEHNWYNIVHKQNSIFPLSTIKFNSIEFPCPYNTDLYLRDLYGDYTIIPPVDKQVYHSFFLDLNNSSPFVKSQSFTKNISVFLDNDFNTGSYIKSLKSLSNNTVAKRSIVYITKNEISLTEYNQIVKLKSFFFDIVFIDKEDNLEATITKLLTSIDKLIITNTSILVSKEFLFLLNYQLYKYEFDSGIFCVLSNCFLKMKGINFETLFNFPELSGGWGINKRNWFNFINNYSIVPIEKQTIFFTYFSLLNNRECKYYLQQKISSYVLENKLQCICTTKSLSKFIFTPYIYSNKIPIRLRRLIFKKIGSKKCNSLQKSLTFRIIDNEICVINYFKEINKYNRKEFSFFGSVMLFIYNFIKLFINR